MTARKKTLGQELRDFVGSIITFPADYLGGWMSMPPALAGVEVNELTAMQIAAFVGCLRVISGTIATMPFRVYEILEDGSEKLAADHPLDNVLNNQPNPETSAADFWQTVMIHLLLTGNSYPEQAYNKAGQSAALYLRSPFRTYPYRLQDGSLVYKTNDTPGQYERLIRAVDMCHIRGMGLDGLVGLSPIKYYAREVLGCDLAAQQYSAKFFANDSRPGGYFSSKTLLNKEKKAEMVSSWVAAHTGAGANRMAVLDGETTWVKVGVNPEEAQFLQTRKLNREQIASIFGVPVHFLGDSETSRANMEQRAVEFLSFTIKPYIAKIEQVINSRMFPKIGRHANRFHARMDTTMFERATYADLLKGIQMGRYAGLYTVNEGRKLMGEQPYTKAQLDSKDPGDKLWQPVNMVVVTPDSVNGDLPTVAGGGEGQGGDDQNGGDGGGKPPITTGQGGKRDAELKRYFAIFYPVFRDALGRLFARRKMDAKDFQRAFQSVLIQIATTYAFRSDAEPQDMVLPDHVTRFVRDYIEFLADRGREWKEERADSIASEELMRSLRVLREKCAPEALADQTDERDEQEHAAEQEEAAE